MPALLGTRRVPYLGGAWTPARLPGLVLWLDAGSIGQADNTSVALWRDRSGKGNDAVQGTVAAQPTYLAAGLAGRPALNFEGVDDSMAIADAASLRWGTGGFAVFLAYSIAVLKGNVSQNTLASKNFTAWEWDQYQDVSPPPGYQRSYLGGSAVANQLQGGTALSVSVAAVGALTRDGAGNAALWLNGAADGTLAQAADVSGAGTALVLGARSGGSLWLTGNIGAMVAYNRTLSAPERSQVTRYLGQRYGVAVQ